MATGTTGPVRRSWYRRLPRWFWIIVAVGVILLIVLIVLRLRRPVVTLTPVRQGEAITAVYAPGTVLSGTQTVIASTAASRIVALYILRGSNVISKQIVALLDDTQARLQLEQAQRDLNTSLAQLAQVSEPGDPLEVQQARASLAQAQANYRQALNAVSAANAAVRGARSQAAQARAAVRTASARATITRRNVLSAREQRNTVQEQVGVADAQVAAAEASLANAQDELIRLLALYQQGAVAERQIVQARTAVQTAAANLAQARANALAARRQVAQADAAIAVAEAQVIEAESAIDQARAEQAQAEAAISVAQAQQQEALAQASAAREQITAAQARLTQVQRGQRSSAVRVAEAQVQAAQARVAQARENLANYTVRSLVNGEISDVPVEVGDFVPLGGTIASVVSPRSLYVQADVDEADIGPIEYGQIAYFTTDTVPGKTYQGAVSEIGASATEETNTYPVEIRNLSTTAGLRVNLSVDVNIVTSRNPSALLVPASAVVTEPEPLVWLVDKYSRLQSRAVTTGARDTASGAVEIRQGVSPGELVVTNPQPSFRNGMRVRISGIQE